MRVLTVTVTARGSALANKLPYEHSHGNAAATIKKRWTTVDGLILFLATGAAVRIIAPLLTHKGDDPAVVCVDERARFAIALCGGHGSRSDPHHMRSANDLAEEVSAILGSMPIITTASDATATPALDTLYGFPAHGDLAPAELALIDGMGLEIDNPLNWPLPPKLLSAATRTAEHALEPDRPRMIITDSSCDSLLRSSGPTRLALSSQCQALPEPHPPPARGDLAVSSIRRPQSPGGRPQPARQVAVLHPPSLVVGIGASTGAPPKELLSLLEEVTRQAGLSMASICEIATIDRRASDPVIVELGLPIRAFSSTQLATVEVPSPSRNVQCAIGTPSVAEAAAILAAGSGCELVCPKAKRAHVTIAVARRVRPRGAISLVGLGPGGRLDRTPAATAALRHAEVLIGYGPYLDQCVDAITANQEVLRFPIGAELRRAHTAVSKASEGRRVAVVCSGDSGIYAMAAVVIDAVGRAGLKASFGRHLRALPSQSGIPGDIDLEVVPGISAATASAAALGAPLGHDHAVISLSDLLTPWEQIEARLRAAAQADMAMAIYNPRSSRRAWQLGRAREILLEHRCASTPVGVVTSAGRSGERVVLTCLGDIDPEEVGMSTCVIIGSSDTKVINGLMVTGRHYSRIDCDDLEVDTVG